MHVALVALAIRSVRITGPPPEPAAIGVQLVQLRPPPPRPERPRTAKAAPQAAPAASPAPAAAAPILIPPPTAASGASTAPPPSDDAAGRVRALLRGSAGCDSAAFLKLSEAEQRKCAKWRTAAIDPNLQIPAPIDPVKRAWNEASLAYRKNGRYMPVGAPGLGVMKVPGLPPGHTLFRVGPISIGLPPGAFNDDDAPPP
jgi:hypothetical protein